MTTAWTVLRSYDLTPSVETSDAWEDRLAPWSAVVSHEPGGGVSVTVHVSAESAQQALEDSAHVDAIAGAAPIGLQVLTDAEHERRAASRVMPELMSSADVAHHLKVSRQRVHQLRSTTAFPEPLANLRGGPIWDAAAIRAFASTWTRKPGRPLSSAPTTARMSVVVPDFVPDDEVARVIGAEVDRALQGNGTWAMRCQYRLDPSPRDDGNRHFEVVFGLVPGTGPGDETIADPPGYRPSAFEYNRQDPGPQPRSSAERRTVINNRRIVQRRADGNWEVRKQGAVRASDVVATQSDGIDRARMILGNDGGGELQVRGRDDVIREQDTSAPGSDPKG